MLPIIFQLSPTQFGRIRPLKNFKMAALAAILDTDCDNILEILNLNIAPIPPM